jgi:hypothetical protein
MTPRPDKAVKVFAPTGAPHLARIADEISALPTGALLRLLHAGAEIEQRREEFEGFLLRIGVKRWWHAAQIQSRPRDIGPKADLHR